MTKAQLKKIIEQELLKEFGDVGGLGGNLGGLRKNKTGEEEDEPDWTLRKRYEEVLDPDAPAEDYIEDFQKSDAPQFQGKSKEKKIEMAIAAHASAQKKRG